MSSIAIRWTVRIGLFGAAALCYLVWPLIAFAGLDGAGAPVPWAALWGIVVAFSPVILGLGFVFAGLWFERHPNHAIYGFPIGVLLIVGTAWVAIFFVRLLHGS
ncbi:hypothetical protein CWB41_04590 [Methylovirgula ligni]|nr:hypothetical protein CWB41_04590 [Methylovirgula ligni]